jgi:hypothetical protein
MQVEAVYSRGTLKFTQPVHLVRDSFRVCVELPDDVVVIDDTLSEAAENIRPHIQPMIDELRAILDDPVLHADDLTKLTERRERRFESFELRRKLQMEQGREA